MERVSTPDESIALSLDIFKKCAERLEDFAKKECAAGVYHAALCYLSDFFSDLQGKLLRREFFRTYRDTSAEIVSGLYRAEYTLTAIEEIRTISDTVLASLSDRAVSFAGLSLKDCCSSDLRTIAGLSGTDVCAELSELADAYAEAYWKNADPAQYGPVRQLTSLGNVVGECFAPGADAESLYVDFLVNKLETTLQYVNMTEAELMDHASSQLGISEDRAYELELEAGYHTPMSDDELPLPSDPATGDQASKDESSGDEFAVGDVNADGKLNIKDATTIQKFVAKMIELDEKAQARADYNADGKVNVKDATMIQKKIANLI